MYFEIYKSGKLVKRGDDILNELSWEVELMEVPSMDLTLPIDYLDYISGREEIKVYANDKIFWGIVIDLEVNKEEEIIEVNLNHIVHEWTYRHISINNAVKDKTINVIYKKEDKGSSEPTVQDQLEDIYNDTNFAYPGWEINFIGNAGDRTIDYVYSKQNKLEALTKTCELTPDLFWRVDFSGEKRIDIGSFGEQKPFIISKKPQGETNITIITEPTIDYDFENVINLATVYGDKSDSGMSSVTLREVYNNKDLQIDGFPVYLMRTGVNNERNYSMYGLTQNIKIAPNNEVEFCVLDTESVALEGGAVLEDSYSNNDISPFNVDSKTIKDEDRIKASKTLYEATIKKLKGMRRTYQIQMLTSDMPVDIKVGDKVRFIYDNSIYKLEACTNYMKKILTMNDWFYIPRIEYEVGIGGVGVATVTLEKYLKIDRETDNT